MPPLCPELSPFNLNPIITLSPSRKHGPMSEFTQWLFLAPCRLPGAAEGHLPREAAAVPGGCEQGTGSQGAGCCLPEGSLCGSVLSLGSDGTRFPMSSYAQACARTYRSLPCEALGSRTCAWDLGDEGWSVFTSPPEVSMLRARWNGVSSPSPREASRLAGMRRRDSCQTDIRIPATQISAVSESGLDSLATVHLGRPAEFASFRGDPPTGR